MATSGAVGEVRVVGSAHSGWPGDYRTTLFLARRSASGAGMVWKFAKISSQGPTHAERFMGVATTAAGLLAVAGSSETAFLATFDRDLVQTGWHELPGVSDPHSIVFESAFLFVVSSGTNEVIRYRLTDNGPTNPVVVFSVSSDEPQHFNGLVRLGDSVVLSAFGTSAREAPTSSNTGYLVDTVTRVLLRTGLDQPHTPYTHCGELIFCESRPSRLYRGEQVSTVAGAYLRGLTIAPDGLL